jgi:hypothetical protein
MAIAFGFKGVLRISEALGFAELLFDLYAKVSETFRRGKPGTQGPGIVKSFRLK